jgi:adenylate cyclase class 2
MSTSPSHREIEIKLVAPDAASARRLLRRAGFRLARRRVFESNIVFDTAAGDLRAAGELLRVREVKGRGLLTFKGPAAPGKHKSREELEVGVSSPEAMLGILDHLGLRPLFRYEKYRTEFTDGEGLATLDETPIGDFFELEGRPGWIDRAAGRLGFAESDYLLASYAGLYLDHCRRHGREPTQMVFQGARGQRRSV